MTDASEDTSKKAATARGEANAYSTIGVLAGAAAPLLLVSGEAIGGIGGRMAEGAYNSKSIWKKVGFASGLVALGAAVYAAVKYSYAHELEAKNKHNPADWRTRIQNGRFTTEIDEQNSRYL